MRILTVLLTGILATAWANARLPWSPFALYFTTLVFMGSYLCLTAAPLESKGRARFFRRDWALEALGEDDEDSAADESMAPWSVGFLCFVLGRVGHHARDEASAVNLGLL